MALGVTDTSVVSALPQAIYNRTLIERAVPALIHGLGAQEVDIPLNNSDSVVFTVFESLPKGTELIEGVNPEPVQLSRSTVTAQLREFGAYVKVTKKVLLTVQDPILTDIAKLLGENAGETFDAVYRDAMAATTSAYYATNLAQASVNSNDDINTVPSSADLKAVVLALRNAKCKTFYEIVPPGPGTATIPVGQAYLGITSWAGADMIARSVTAGDWVPIEKYPNQSMILPNEVGSFINGVASIRILATTEAYTKSGGGHDTDKTIHTLLVYGQNAIGKIKLSGNSLVNIVKSPEQIGGALNRYGTSGWSGFQNLKILNSDYITRYEFLLETDQS